MELDGPPRIVSLFASPFQIAVNVKRDIGKHAVLVSGSKDLLKRGARLQELCNFPAGGVGVVASVGLVAKNQTIVGIKKHEAFGDGLDRFAQLSLCLFERLGQLLLFRDVAGRPRHAVGAPVFIPKRAAVLARPAPTSVLGPITVFAMEAIGLAFHVSHDRPFVMSKIVRVDQADPGIGVSQFLRGIAQKVGKPSGEQHLLGVHAPVVNAGLNRIHGQGVAFLADSQRLR